MEDLGIKKVQCGARLGSMSRAPQRDVTQYLYDDSPVRVRFLMKLYILHRGHCTKHVSNFDHESRWCIASYVRDIEVSHLGDGLF